jgi:hemerythrin-like metal-binding protein
MNYGAPGQENPMPHLVWNPSLRVGIGPLDKDHREFMADYNALEMAVEDGSDGSVTLPLLLHLDRHTRAHFTAETAMMSHTHYPGAQLHGIKHERLLEQLHALVERSKRNPATLDKHSLSFLREWATTHIENDDRNFGLWLEENGKR